MYLYSLTLAFRHSKLTVTTRDNCIIAAPIVTPLRCSDSCVAVMCCDEMIILWLYLVALLVTSIKLCVDVGGVRV